MSDGPVVSTHLITNRLEAHEKLLEVTIEQLLENVSFNLNQTMKHAIAEAYQQGLVDGFAQRVYADAQEEVSRDYDNRQEELGDAK